MRTIFQLLLKYRLTAAVAILLMFAELAVELLQPYFIARIIDDGIQQRDLSVVTMWGGVLLGCTALAFVVGILSSFFAAHVSQSFGYELRERLYDKVQSFTFAAFGRFAESSLITRLTNDVTQLQNTVFMGLRIMLRAPLFVVGSVLMAFIVNPSLAVWFAAAIPFLALFLAWVMRRGEALFRSVQSELDRVNGVMQQNLIGMRLIRAFVRMKHESDRFAAASGALMEKTAAALRLTELTLPVILLVMNGCVIAILWFGKLQLDAGGAASVGDVVAIVNYATRTTGALSMMSMIVVNFSRAKASAQRIGEVIDTEDRLTGGEAGDDGAARIAEGSIAFRDVAFRYPDTGEAVLTGVSFRAKAGETVAIMGATGSGKSSLLSLIPRLYEAERGVIEIDGRSVDAYGLDRLRGGIGYVPQDIMLFTGSVADNIRWGRQDASMDEIIEAAKFAQIHETIMTLPHGYDSVVGQKGVNLSGGQKQRLTIARALVRKPAILLLDDCTSALDAQTEARLMKALRGMSCTILLVTQKISSAEGADRILLLDDGRLLADGKHDELLNRSELYRQIYESQTGKAGVSHA